MKQLFSGVAQNMIQLSPTNTCWCSFSATTMCSHYVSTELVPEPSKTKRVRIAEEVILEDESKPKKKKKKDGGK